MRFGRAAKGRGPATRSGCVYGSVDYRPLSVIEAGMVWLNTKRFEGSRVAIARIIEPNRAVLTKDAGLASLQALDRSIAEPRNLAQM